MWRSKETREKTLEAMREAREIIFADVETTGLSADNDVIIQISAIKLTISEGKTGDCKETMDIFINPERSLLPKIVELTGITDDMLMKSPTETEVFPEIQRFFKDAQVIVGHNVPFDLRFINAMYARQNAELEVDYVLDTLEIARDIIPSSETENFKLATLSELYGLNYGLTFHNSLDDVIATRRLFDVLVKEYEKETTTRVEKKVARVFSLSYWPGFKGYARIYINTNIGGFFYDIRKKIWDKKPDNPNEIDTVNMEQLRNDALKMAGAHNELEFAKFRG